MMSVVAAMLMVLVMGFGYLAVLMAPLVAVCSAFAVFGLAWRWCLCEKTQDADDVFIFDNVIDIKQHTLRDYGDATERRSQGSSNRGIYGRAVAAKRVT